MTKYEIKEEAKDRTYETDKEYEYDCGYNHGEADGYEAGFIDGAEYALSIAYKWHDLIKDPTDLPANDNEVIVINPRHSRGVLLDRYLTKEWFYSSNSSVIAWIEIPTFTDMETAK